MQLVKLGHVDRFALAADDGDAGVVDRIAADDLEDPAILVAGRAQGFLSERNVVEEVLDDEQRAVCAGERLRFGVLPGLERDELAILVRCPALR